MVLLTAYRLVPRATSDDAEGVDFLIMMGSYLLGFPTTVLTDLLVRVVPSLDFPFPWVLLISVVINWTVIGALADWMVRQGKAI